MKILVAVASKHGSTQEIAYEIGKQLKKHGQEVTVMNFDDVGDISGYECFVLGSAVYSGHWLRPARDFIHGHTLELSHKPVWLFSSGPVGEPLKPDRERSVLIDDLEAETGAKEHHLFAGKLDKHKLNLAERALVRAFHTPYGDYRDWKDVVMWALKINKDIQTNVKVFADDRRTPLYSKH